MRVVTVSAVADQDEMVLAAFRAGAIGHIDKDIDPDQFARLVTRAADGEAIVPKRLMTPLLERLRREMPAGGWRPLRSALTTREWQIVELLGDGASTEQITQRLVLSPSTVYCHIYRVLRKLGVHSRRDAVDAAQRLRQEEASMRTLPRIC
jgi:DNA-binding NarL/FixJ family response regulator